MDTGPTTAQRGAAVSHRDPRMLAAVAMGGAVGGLARAALEEWRPAGGRWPWTTFLINLVGAAVLAWVATDARIRWRFARPLLGTGVCGALTTFAAMQVEIVGLVRHGNLVLAAGYGAATLVGGLVVMVAVVRVVGSP